MGFFSQGRAIVMDVREASISGNTARHPWELARVALVQGMVKRTGGIPSSILDVGSGDAFVLESFQACYPAARVVGVEPELDELARRPTVPLVKSLDDVGGQRFELVLLLDVLEHLEDDSGFLTRIVRDHLVPGGRVVATVPAHQWLFSEHDRFLKHFRRYSTAQFDELAEASGLRVITSGQLFHSLLPVRAAQKAMGAIGGSGVSNWDAGRALSAVVTGLLRADAILPTWLPGLSVFGVWKT